MKSVVTPWAGGADEEALAEVAQLWNRNAPGRHAFFPWSGKLLAGMFSGASPWGGRLIEARVGGELAGFAHVTWMHEYGYPPGGAVEALLVDESHRGRGLGTALLAAGLGAMADGGRDLSLVDALGAWPYGFLYAALADGSERSGVFSGEPGLRALFRGAGFRDARKSLVMRAPSGPPPPPLPRGMAVSVARRPPVTWLDFVFRARELWDHNLVGAGGDVLSRAIYGIMRGESAEEGRSVAGVFGVNTPVHCRGRGYAGLNIAHLLAHLAGLGVDAVELHVYADNDSALALYARAGFVEIADTMMMRREP